MALGERSALSMLMTALDSRADAGTVASHFPVHSSVFDPVWEGKQNVDAQVPLEIELQKLNFEAPSFGSPAEDKCILELQELENASRDKLLPVLRDFLQDEAEQEGSHAMDFDGWIGLATCQRVKLYSLVKKHAQRFSHRLVVAILRCCVRIQCWDPVYAFLECGRVSGNECPEVIDWMVEQGNVAALCVCLNRVPDLRPSHRRDILKVFLSDGGVKQKKWLFVLREVYREVSLCVMDEAAMFKDGDKLATSSKQQGFQRLSLLSKKGKQLLPRNGTMQNWLKLFEDPGCWISEEEHKQWVSANAIATPAAASAATVPTPKTVWKSLNTDVNEAREQNADAPGKKTPKKQKGKCVIEAERKSSEGHLIKFQSLLTASNTKDRAEQARQAFDTAVDIAAAFDLFSDWELCLNCYLCAGIDEAVLSLVVSQMNTREVLRLVHYLNKWLVKYTNKVRPSHAARLEAARRFVPSHDTVVQWLAVILEDRFASFVLSRELKKELLISRGLVESLLEQAKVVSLVGMTKHLLKRHGLPAASSGSGISDHVIEYLRF